MTTLTDLLRRARETREGRRARRLAMEDLRMLQSLVGIRIQSGVTQAEIAEKLGLSQQAVSKFERHDADPRLSAIRRYASAVGALVGHVVEPDTGQLERGEWTVVAYSFGSLSAGSQGSTTYVAAGLKRTDVALAG